MTTMTTDLKALNHVLSQLGIPEADLAYATGAEIKAFANPDHVIIITDEGGLAVPTLGESALIGLNDTSQPYDERQEIRTILLPAPYRDGLKAAYDFLRGVESTLT